MAHAQVPAHTQENDVGLEVTPFERILHCHDEELLCSAPNKEEFIHHTFILATQPIEVSSVLKH